MAINPQQKIQITSTFLNGPNPISGYDSENGNGLVGGISQVFGANTNGNSISLSFNSTKLQAITLLSDKGCSLYTNGLNSAEVQTITITGTPTGGSVGLAWNGTPTIVAYNTNAATMQTALQSLAGNGNVTCGGGPLPGTPITCTFAGTLNAGQQPLITAYGGALTGGTNAAVSVARTNAGLPTQVITLQPGIPLAWGVSMGTANPFNSNVNAAYVFNNAAQNLQIGGLTL